MQANRTTTLIPFLVVLAVATTGAVGAQDSQMGYPPQPQGGSGYDEDRYDDQRYDDDRYDDDRYGPERYEDARRSPRVDVGFFYEELSPYGDWLLSHEYGWAWFPRNVSPYWRPYSDGRWVNTEYGWTWVSYEPFGWATYHYGRWAWDQRFGWLWIPGTVWGPAWVSWQYGGGYVGWAPLPPSVGFEIGIGIRLGGLDINIGIRPDAYSFVRERSFLEPRISTHFQPIARNVTIINNTTNITNYTYIDNRVVNRGVDVRRMEQATGQRINQRRLATSPTRARNEVDRSEVRIYRPGRQSLESVRVTPWVDAGRTPATTSPVRDQPGRGQPQPQPRPNTASPRPERVLEVAPRVDRTPRIDVQRLDRDDQRAQQELERYQAAEKRRLEKLQREETARAATPAARPQVERNHEAERAALEEQQRVAAQQLEARQRVRRQAVEAKPVEVKPVDPPKANAPARNRDKPNNADKPKKPKG